VAETKGERTQRATKILELLGNAMPEAKIELDHETPWQLIVAVVLSAQSTDRGVNRISPALHAALPGPAAFARVTPQEVEPHIKTLGLFRNKAKSLVALAKALLEQHGGEVPLSRAALAELPGVGNKTAGVVSMHLGGDRAFPVDTHVTRLAFRMGFTRETKPDKIEAALQALLPSELWFQGHQLLVWHGRRVCHAIKPECHRCVVKDLCPMRGVKAQHAKAKPKPKKAKAKRRAFSKAQPATSTRAR
jgi:endonuclease-3